MNTNPKELAHIQGIVFDIDGVIFDSRNANISYYNTIRNAVGMPSLSKEEEDFCHMASAQQAYEHIVPKNKREAVNKALKEHPYNSHVLPQLKIEQGLLETLAWLQDLGIKLGIFTNRSNAVPDLLHRFGLDSFFTILKTAYCCSPKPNPQGLLEIMDEWGLSAKSVAFLGDTMVDKLAAKEAGVHFWAFRSPSLKASLHFNDFFSFMAIINPLVDKKN